MDLSESDLRTLLNFILSGLLGTFGGLIGALLIGIIHSTFVAWMMKNSFSTLYDDSSLLTLSVNLLIYTDIPIGLLLGFTTGIHHLVFLQLIPVSFYWGLISGLGTTLAYITSGFYQHDKFVYISIVMYFLIGFASGWFSDKLSWKFLKSEYSVSRLSIKALISGLVPVFVIVFLFFSALVFLASFGS